MFGPHPAQMKRSRLWNRRAASRTSLSRGQYLLRRRGNLVEAGAQLRHVAAFVRPAAQCRRQHSHHHQPGGVADGKSRRAFLRHRLQLHVGGGDARAGVGGGDGNGIGPAALRHFQSQEGVGLGAAVADDDNAVVGIQGRRVGAELEGVAHFNDRPGTGELAEPVPGHQPGVPRRADAHQVDAPFLRQLRRHRLNAGGVLGQHLLHRFRLAHDGVIHEIRVPLAYILLLNHNHTPDSRVIRPLVTLCYMKRKF